MTTKTARQPKGIPVGGQFAATSHAEPDVSLAAPAAKTSSKGRTTTVTLPDGSVATRTSKTMVYTHAVVRSAEVPELVIANRENQIAYSEKIIKDIDDALVNPVFKISRRFNDRDRDPDMSYDGTTPSYHGFEAHLMSADGKTRLYSTHCNSKGLCEGVYDYETKTYDGKAIQAAPKAIRAAVAERQQNARETIAAAQADIEAVKAGTYKLGGPGVVRWSTREDLAVKAANGELRHEFPTRRTSIVPVD